MAEATGECEGTVTDISASGAAIEASARPRMGEKIILYIDGFNRFDAEVTRFYRGGFAVRLLMSPRKAEVLTEDIRRRIAGEERATPRPSVDAGTQRRRVICRLPGGKSIEAHIADLSVVGATLETPARPTIGSPILVGTQKGVVARHAPNGFAVEFVEYWKSMTTGYQGGADMASVDAPAEPPKPTGDTTESRAQAQPDTDPTPAPPGQPHLRVVNG